MVETGGEADKVSRCSESFCIERKVHTAAASGVFFNPGSRLRRADGDLQDDYPRSFPLGINPAPVELLENCKSPENILRGLFYSFAGEGKSVNSKRGRLRGASVQKPNRFQCGLRAYRL